MQIRILYLGFHRSKELREKIRQYPFNCVLSYSGADMCSYRTIFSRVLDVKGAYLYIYPPQQKHAFQNF